MASTDITPRPPNSLFPTGEPPGLMRPVQPPDDGIDLVQLWTLLRQNIRLIARIGAGIFGLVLVITLLSRMEFKSSGRLYLGELDSKPVGNGQDIDLSGGGQNDVTSEIEILKSQALVRRAVLSSGANVALSPEGWSPPRYWQWLLGGRSPELIDVAERRLTAVDTTLGSEVRDTQTYAIKFVTEDEYEVWQGDRRLGAGRLGTPARMAGLQLTLRPGSRGKPEAKSAYAMKVVPLSYVVDDTLKLLNVWAPKPIGSGNPVKVVTLEFAHGSPRMAAELVRHLMEAYLQERQTWKTEDASAAEAFVTKQLQIMRESLDSVGKKLADYRSTTDGVVLDSEAKAMIEQIAKYEEQRVAARLQVAALSDTKRALKNPNTRLEAFLVGEATDTVLAGLASSLSTARQELASLEERYQEAAPDVRQQRAQVATQLEMTRNYVTSRLSRAQENLGTLNSIIGQFETKLKAVPGAELGLAQLTRESEVYSKTYSYLLERQQQAAIVKASTVSKNRILDVPEQPAIESSPRLGLRLGGGLLGLLFGAVFVVARSRFTSTFQSESDVHRAIGALPILARVPPRSGALPSATSTAKQRGYDFLGADPYSGFTEAFRVLRAHLVHSAAGRRGQVILLTSPSSGDGKTTCVLSLAAILAADKKWVLVIDADLRKPSLHEVLGHPQEPGLGDVLSGQCDWHHAVHPCSVPHGEFYAITAGRVSYAELLAGDRLAPFLRAARERFDFIIVDSSIFPAVSDPLVLSASADVVLSVLRLQHTPRRLAADHVQRLAARIPSYGVIVNGVDPVQNHGSRKQDGHHGVVSEQLRGQPARAFTRG